MGFHHFTDEQTEATEPHPKLQDSLENKDVLPPGQGTEASVLLCGLQRRVGKAPQSGWAPGLDQSFGVYGP